MLWVLVILLFLLVYLNFKWSNHDIFHPSVAINTVFFIFALICLVLQETYLIRLSDKTVLVILLGMMTFTAATFLSRYFNTSDTNLTGSLKKIHVSSKVVIGLIVIQILAIVFFIKYLENISIAWRGYSDTITKNISLYDTMTKFWVDRFRTLNVTVPMFYRLANPIVDASSWFVLYIAVHNYVVTKKINVLYIISILLQCTLIFLNGSRSPLFRILTFAIVVYFVLIKKQYGRVMSAKNYLYLCGVAGISGVLFIVMLSLMRTVSIDNLQDYFFTYAGAQIENLNNVLREDFQQLGTGLFGEQTFRNLYHYIGKLFNVEYFSYGTIDTFTFSQTGVEIGNVYTMFYAFMYDFGYVGVIILTGIMAYYYVFTYDKLYKQSVAFIDFKLIIYAFLFNDLVMSAFSNRFYNTVLDAPFLKMCLVMYPIYLLFIKYTIIIKKDEKNGNVKIKILNKMKESIDGV